MSAPSMFPASATEYGGAEGYSLKEVPRFVQFTSPVSTSPANGITAGIGLPLNLIALIVSSLDDIADIARVTRTSRLLYYMTLPQLYKSVTLHSYPEIRYVDGRPEGYGSGSPFAMALNGLVSKPHGALVQDLRVCGAWREVGTEDFAKGRVPDNSMMLSILLRVAVDKMAKLHTFAWELDCKPLKPLYQGLSARPNLTSLTLRFPSSRIPRPSIVVPPMSALREFRMTDYDPLCYPDDLTVFMLHSRHLQDIRLHFSPRMRREAEPTLSLEQIFGRCFNAGYRIPCRHFALQNFFGPNIFGIDAVFDAKTCTEIVFVDTFGGVTGASANVFVDDTWRLIPLDMETHFKSVRCTELATHQVEMIRRAEGLEKIYFISSKHATPSNSPTSAAVPPPSGYLHALTRSHGDTLRHLLLNDQWALTRDEIGEVVRFCPNLEQLGLAVDTADCSALGLLVPSLPRLKALRILFNDDLEEYLRRVGHEWIEHLSRELCVPGPKALEWVAFGEDVFKIGGIYRWPGEDGDVEVRREVVRRSRAEVEAEGVEIWTMDCLDIMVG